MLFVKNLDRMVLFYRDTLGLSLIVDTRTDSWAEFQAGSTTIALHAIPTAIASQIEITDPPEPREDVPVKLIFEVKDLEAENHRLTALGMKLTRHEWGAMEGTDPEGNILQFV